MEKCTYIEPEMEVIIFDTDDVITTSSTNEILLPWDEWDC